MNRRMLAALLIASVSASVAVAGTAPLRAAIVKRISPGGRGDLAGVLAGDIVVACHGKRVASPRDLKLILQDAREKLTVEIRVWRNGREMKLDIIPGLPDFYCEQHFRRYEALLAGPNSSPKWNTFVRDGYAAFKKGDWRGAVEHFEKAVARGLADPDVLQHLTRACLSSLQGEKARSYAVALLELNEADKDSAMLLYLACLMSGEYGQAMRLARRVPKTRYLTEQMVDREKDARLLAEADVNKRRYLAAGGDVDKRLDPLAGVRAWTRGLRDRTFELRDKTMKVYRGDIMFHGGSDVVGDFVLSFTVTVVPWTWDREERPVLAHVSDEQNRAILNVGADQKGRLLLGQNWFDIVGPCEAVKPEGEANSITIIRRGQRIDAVVNEAYVASTFVSPDRKLRLYVSFTNGAYKFERVTLVSVNPDPRDKSAPEVKIGVAGEDTDRIEATSEGPLRPEPRGRTPAEVEALLVILRRAAAKGDYAGTRRSLEVALRQADMAEFKEEVRAAIRVARTLESRRGAIVRGAEALVGKDVTLTTRTGQRKGTVDGTSPDGIVIVTRLIVRGRLLGESRATIKWSSLALEEQDRLAASWQPEGPDGAVARAILALARNDEVEAARVVASAGEHPLGKYLCRGATTAPGVANEGPKVWTSIEERCAAKNVSVADELAIDRDIRAFKKKLGTRIDSTLRRRMVEAVTRAKRASGLVAHWTFDEGKGTIARDSSGNGNHGAVHRARWVRGKIGPALDFNRTADYVEVKDNGSFKAPEAVTVAMWVKLEHIGRRMGGRDYAIIAKSGQGLGTTFGLRVENWRGVLKWQANSDDTRLESRTQLSPKKWYHVVCTYDGRIARMYLNGQEDASGVRPWPLSSTSAPIWIGGRKSTSGRGDCWDGLIDDVRVYKRALTAGEVEALVALGE